MIGNNFFHFGAKKKNSPDVFSKYFYTRKSPKIAILAIFACLNSLSSYYIFYFKNEIDKQIICEKDILHKKLLKTACYIII